MKPYLHGKVSVSKWGGKPEDYQEIHDFLDSSKSAHADMRHRAILHNSLGCYIAERVFGINIVNSDGKTVSVRDIAEQHIIDDMGRIPSLGDYLNDMPFYDWLGGKKKVTRQMSYEEVDAKLNPDTSPTIPAKQASEAIEESTAEFKRRQALYTPYDPKTSIID